MFSCIYCHNSAPDVRPSDAHIFPDAMGGVCTSEKTVCEDCNSKINRDFEMSEIGKFGFFQSIWGIRSRRGKVGGVRATVHFAGKQLNTSLDEHGLPKSALVTVENLNDDKKGYNIFGPSKKVEEKRKEIEAKDPTINWEEKDTTGIQPPESVVEIASDLGRTSLRRLAAKVAFERWAQIRGSMLLIDKQYDAIRNFILTGTEHGPNCGILSDCKVINGMLNFPVGHHAVVIVANPKSPMLGAFVTFYSLFYFWVILSKSYRSLAPFDDALIEDPQQQIIYTPRLRAGLGDLLIHWEVFINSSRINPLEIENSAMKYAIDKFQESANEFYESKNN